MISARIAAFGSLLIGCASGNSSVSNLGHGIYEIRCKGSALVSCLQQAERVCRGQEYDVLRAQDQRKRYGGDVGTSVIEERASIAKIRCAATGRPLLDYYEDEETEAPSRPWKLERREPEVAQPPLAPLVTTAPSSAASPGAAAPPATPNAAKPAEAPSRACVPGSTQACVGPGACNGGQSCLPDGSGYAPCDCGSKPPTP